MLEEITNRALNGKTMATNRSPDEKLNLIKSVMTH
jgi:hypothetical protein